MHYLCVQSGRGSLRSAQRSEVADCMQVGLFVLIPLAFLQLYTYMLQQRSKRLADVSVKGIR